MTSNIDVRMKTRVLVGGGGRQGCPTTENGTSGCTYNDWWAWMYGSTCSCMGHRAIGFTVLTNKCKHS